MTDSTMNILVNTNDRTWVEGEWEGDERAPCTVETLEPGLKYKLTCDVYYSKDQVFEMVISQPRDRAIRTFVAALVADGDEEMAECGGEVMTRSLHEIATEVDRDLYDTRATLPHAEPYLNAMLNMSSIDDTYFGDDGRDIVLRFLGNAGSWRGETARRIKAELKGMLKKKPASKKPR